MWKKLYWIIVENWLCLKNNVDTLWKDEDDDDDDCRGGGGVKKEMHDVNVKQCGRLILLKMFWWTIWAQCFT